MICTINQLTGFCIEEISPNHNIIKWSLFVSVWSTLITSKHCSVRVHTCVWVSGDKKCLLFEIIGELGLLVTIVLRFILLLYYWRVFVIAVFQHFCAAIGIRKKNTIRKLYTRCSYCIFYGSMNEGRLWKEILAGTSRMFVSL